MAGYIGSKAVNLSTTGADINGNANIDGDLSFGDNDKAIFGAGSDLQIYHDGSNSIIRDAGTGNLKLQAGNFELTNGDGTQSIITGVVGGAVRVYHNNSQVLTTISSGASITGSLGIGTSSPDEMLHVDGGNMKFTNTVSNDSRIYFTHTTTANRRSYIGALETDGNGNSLIFAPNANGEDASEAMRIDSSGNVGIGTSSPTAVAANYTTLHLDGSSGSGIHLTKTTSGTTATDGSHLFNAGGDFYLFHYESGNIVFSSGTSATERMRIDGSGNLLVGTTDTDPSNDTSGTGGIALGTSSYISLARANSTPLLVNRIGTDGENIIIKKDGTSVGSIGVETVSGTGYPFICNTQSGNAGLYFAGRIQPTDHTGDRSDNTVDLGFSSFRFDDIYATNGTIQTSDRNEKQDIAELSDAEQRVAVAAKGLMRKFRWRDAVAEKGDEARTHFGIIAQDLQAAFAAEGLDAGDYAMFISSTWTDEETGEERTRMGVRYSELLAFIIGAL
jgi:hypothetical protein